jgi:hypothetical protein
LFYHGNCDCGTVKIKTYFFTIYFKMNAGSGELRVFCVAFPAFVYFCELK